MPFTSCRLNVYNLYLDAPNRSILNFPLTPPMTSNNRGPSCPPVPSVGTLALLPVRPMHRLRLVAHLGQVVLPLALVARVLVGLVVKNPDRLLVAHVAALLALGTPLPAVVALVVLAAAVEAKRELAVVDPARLRVLRHADLVPRIVRVLHVAPVLLVVLAAVVAQVGDGAPDRAARLAVLGDVALGADLVLEALDGLVHVALVDLVVRAVDLGALLVPGRIREGGEEGKGKEES